MNWTYLDSAARQINAAFPLKERVTPRQVARLAKKLGWQKRKIYGAVAVSTLDLVKYITEHNKAIGK